jgi:CspA family cold shock protein
VAKEETEYVVPTGTVKWYDPDKGYGFVALEDEEADLFVHRSEVGYEVLTEGDRVTFDVGYGSKGANAIGVRIVERSPLPPRRPRGSFGSGVYASNRFRGSGYGQSTQGSRQFNVIGLPLRHGVIRRYDPLRGFGFIRQEDGGDDVFVHRSAFGATVPSEGTRVVFRLGSGVKGPRAEDVQLVDEPDDGVHASVGPDPFRQP